MAITLRPLSNALGAEVQGIDFGKTLSNSEFDQIHQAFLIIARQLLGEGWQCRP